jgi:hypothetical protein
MMRVALLLLLALSLFPLPASAQHNCYLLGFTGYDYESPNFDLATYLAPGDGYKALGFVTDFGPLLTPLVDPVGKEYTFYLYDLTVQDYFFDGTLLEVVFANPGRCRYYQDSRTTGTPAVYGINPPNATAPATFTDGMVILGGAIQNMVLDYDFSLNQGSFAGDFVIDEGAFLGAIPVEKRTGWTISGLVGRPNETVPVGYDHQLSGETYIPGPTPTTNKTWGALKALYR